MIVLQILIVLLGVYLIFSFLPSVVMFRSVFCHRMKAKTDKDYYVPFFPLMEAAEHTLRAIPVTEVSVTAVRVRVLPASSAGVPMGRI